ncbi:hypothetical protein CFP56_040657 [Quercus suber]|uniref:Uncharacterized protein n=1 Tax=Quercus suber TaxID=58331 RepID=A0AAW0IYA7_QUESU
MDIVLFCSSPSSSSSSDSPKTHPDPNNQPDQTAQPKLHVINPEPHISSQFYTFNLESHSSTAWPRRGRSAASTLSKFLHFSHL